MDARSTELQIHVDAPPAVVFHALIDQESVKSWMVPTGKSSEIHEFDAHEGGRFRATLCYDEASDSGKTTS